MMTRNRERLVDLEELAKLIAGYQAEGKTVALCHGCFDLVHPGHLRHFEEAGRRADVLVVTVTPDRYVNKGPGRPLFPEQLRLEQVAALEMIHHVALNRWPTAVETVELLRPDVYVKGSEYEDAGADLTGNIESEARAVESVGGRIHYTHDVMFSSTKLINEAFQHLSDEAVAYVEGLREQFSADHLEDQLNRCSDVSVLIIGDAIIDEYCYCEPMGRVEKAPIISVRQQREERFGGGALAVANQAAQFAGRVRLLTMTGDRDDYRQYAEDCLDPRVQPEFAIREGSHTVTKRRFLDTDGGRKLFEVGHVDDVPIGGDLEEQVRQSIGAALPDVDLVLVADFGHGLITPGIIDFIAAQDVALAVNAQTNSTNFGYNYITRYPRADFISIDENELRLPFQNKVDDLDALLAKLTRRVKCSSINVTAGPQGARFYHCGQVHRAPALATSVVDAVGAGDAVLTVLSLLHTTRPPAEIVPFIGNAVGALAVEIMGNRAPVEKSTLIKFIRGLLA
jgi:cytidyltransferase-like protein